MKTNFWASGDYKVDSVSQLGGIPHPSISDIRSILKLSQTPGQNLENMCHCDTGLILCDPSSSSGTGMVGRPDKAYPPFPTSPHKWDDETEILETMIMPISPSS